MKRFHDDADGTEREEQLDDVDTPPPPPGGGGGQVRKQGPNDSYMETWDVVQAPHPARGQPLPDDEDDDWGGS